MPTHEWPEEEPWAEDDLGQEQLEEVPEQNRRQLEESLSALRRNKAAPASDQPDNADDFITMELVTGDD